LPGTQSGTPAASPSDQQPNLEQAVRSLEEAVRAFNITLNFSRDDETGAIVIKLIDQHSGEIVQQIPTEATLHLSAVLGKLQGQFFNRKA
jgi:flagellar protein FlaG